MDDLSQSLKPFPLADSLIFPTKILEVVKMTDDERVKKIFKFSADLKARPRPMKQLLTHLSRI